VFHRSQSIIQCTISEDHVVIYLGLISLFIVDDTAAYHPRTLDQESTCDPYRIFGVESLFMGIKV